MTGLELQWYCVRSQQKREHIAAAHLSSRFGLEVFAPRISLVRRTRQGTARFTEALFPSYLFARFNLATHLAAVRSCSGVLGVVSFGAKPPPVTETIVEELRSLMQGEPTWMMPDLPAPGSEIQICGGPFNGSIATVLNIREATRRVRVLLEFLGQETLLEVSADQCCQSRETTLLMTMAVEQQQALVRRAVHA